MIALNGECKHVGGCDAGSPQGSFLQANLGQSACTLAYWHEPYYNGSAGHSGNYSYFWNTLHSAGADIVLNGHLHTYGRFDRAGRERQRGHRARHPRVHRRHGRRGHGIAERVDERRGDRPRASASSS